MAKKAQPASLVIQILRNRCASPGLGGQAVIYRFGDISVRSEISLSFLPTASLGALPGICVELGRPIELSRHSLESDPNRRSEASPASFGWRIPDTLFVMRFGELCEFELHVSRRVVVVRTGSTADAATIEHLLVDQVLPKVAAHLGELVLHASMVGIGDRLILFVGASGWGKSTLGAQLFREGATLHADDCVLVRPRGARATAFPAYAGLRLWSDSAARFSWSGIAAPQAMASYSEKLRVSLPAATVECPASPLSAVYCLDDPGNTIDENAIVELGGGEACLALISNSFQLDPSDRSAIARRLERAAALARSTPIFRLRHRRDYAELGRVSELIRTHIAGLSVGAAEPTTHEAYGIRGTQ